MQTPGLGRRFRSRLVAAAVIGALALSMLPAASASADSYVAVAVNIFGLQSSAGVNETFSFQVEAVDEFGFRDTDYGGPSKYLDLSGSSSGCGVSSVGNVFANGVATVSNFSCNSAGSKNIVADTSDLNPDYATIQITSSSAVALNIIGLQSSAGVNQPFSFQVEAVDSSGYRDTSYGGPSKYLDLSGSSSGCGVSSVGNVFANGVATVSNFSCNSSGLKNIVADTSDLNPDYATIQITSSSAVALNIIGLQSSAGVNQSFGFQVEAVDSSGYRDTSYGGPSKYLDLSGSSSGCGVSSVGNVFANGVATVSNFSCNSTGSKNIVADTYDLAPDYATILITSNMRLQFGSYPSTPTPSLLTPQPTVELRDSSGFLVTSFADQLSVTLTVSPATATFTCTSGTTRTTSGGIATFSGCTLPTGTGYTLTASPNLFGSPISPITGASFTVIGRKLTFTQQPGGTNAVPGQALPIQPIIAVQDSAGVTQSSQNNGFVTLTLVTSTVGATMTCTGGLTRNFVNGLAAFSGCAVSAQGTGYLLTAAYTPTLVGEPTVQPVTSTPFNVNSSPAQITLSASATVVTSGQGFTLTAQFANLGAGQSLAFQRKGASDLDWVSFAAVSADASGRASTLVVPTYTAKYRASFAGAGGLSAGVSNIVSVSARFSSGVMTPNYTGTRTLDKSTRVTYSVTSRPLNPGNVVPTVTFQIYKSVNGAWVFQTSATVPSNSSGVATFSWTWSKSGTWYMRGRVNATAYNSGIFTNLAKVKIN